MKKTIFITVSFILITLAKSQAHEVAKAYMDLQIHITMNFPWRFFADPLTIKEVPKNLTSNHMFKNVIHPDFMKNNAGARILINGAMAAERAVTKKQATNLILKQIDHINEWVAKNSNDFAVAKTPEEVRKLLKTTKKTIIIHSIEGGRLLLESQADADFWAKKGIAYMTLIHLLDDEYGGAAHNPGDVITRLINFTGTMSKVFLPHERRGLTDHGKAAVEWLMNAGIMVDITHMSPASVDDTLEIFEARNLPPLATHALFGPIQKSDRGITPQQLIRMYKLGGLFSLPISGEDVKPYKPSKDFLQFIQDEEICEGSLDSYRVAFNYVEKMLKDHAYNFIYPGMSDEEKKVALSLGFQSDFNGWDNHSLPRFGKEGCYETPAGVSLPELETKGLAHPGMMADYWKTLEKEGMNTESLLYSTEKFLRMWETFRTKK